MIITINEFKQHINENHQTDAIFYIDYPSITFEQDEQNMIFKINGTYAGYFRLGANMKIHGMNYLTISTVNIEPEFKRKGIYTSIIKGLAYYCRKVLNRGKSHSDSYGGVVSFPFDPDTEQPRSDEGNAFWINLYNNRDATRREDKDAGYMYWTTKSLGY